MRMKFLPPLKYEDYIGWLIDRLIGTGKKIDSKNRIIRVLRAIDFINFWLRGKFFELKQGRSHGESVGANFACGFSF